MNLVIYDGFKVLSVISKVFDKFYHKLIILKLKRNRISGELVDVFTDFFLKDKK